MKHSIPEAVLTKHTAVVGMTGSGKTSTSKLLIEQVVASGSRVCILDPIKSDWWGLTSNKAGTGPGLPFQILGGPHGHVPLHAGAGAAIADVVASGKLPLSIVDMADFGPGGLQRFFNDFSPALVQKIRGVLYLVIEEAHEFCPKEKSGVSGENMSVYYAKKLATAGRSKGVRLVVATQRVQALHNAVLSSCETVIVHRMTYPADQEPVTKWLKGSVKDKDVRQQIEESMPELADGEAWICSGSAKILERIQFPRIQTFDNSATPEDDSQRTAVVTAQVDVDHLRAIIGDAVTEAAANDPAELKKRIRDLETQLSAQPAAGVDEQSVREAEARGFGSGYVVAKKEGFANERNDLCNRLGRLQGDLVHLVDKLQDELRFERDSGTGFEVPTVPRQVDVAGAPLAKRVANYADPMQSPVKHSDQFAEKRRSQIDDGRATKGLRAQSLKVLQVLSQFREGCTAGKLALLTGYAYGGGFRTSLAELRTRGLIQGDNTGVMTITDEGQACGPFDPLPTGEALRSHWVSHPNFRKQSREILAALLENTRGLTAEQLARMTGYEYGGGFRTSLSELRTAGVIVGKNTETMRASEELLDA